MHFKMLDTNPNIKNVLDIRVFIKFVWKNIMSSTDIPLMHVIQCTFLCTLSPDRSAKKGRMLELVGKITLALLSPTERCHLVNVFECCSSNTIHWNFTREMIIVEIKREVNLQWFHPRLLWTNLWIGKNIFLLYY